MSADTPLYAIGVVKTTPGTITVASGSTGVTGSGTNFVDDVFVGDVIVISGVAFVVGGVATNTSLAVTVAPTFSGSGLAFTVYDLFTTLDARGVPFPKGVFVPYSQPLDLGDGSLRGGGWATAEWQWKFLSRTQRNTLRTLVGSNVSALVYIRTTINDSSDAYATFTAQALWPQTENRDAQRRLAFTLRFRALVNMPTS